VKKPFADLTAGHWDANINVDRAPHFFCRRTRGAAK